jgi:hypothetical protein
MVREEDGTMRLGFAEAVVGVLTRPRATLRQVGGGESLGLALVAWVLVGLITGWSSALTTPEAADMLGGPAGMIAATVAGGGMALLVQAGVCYGLARLLGSRGSFQGLLSGLALANVPSVFTAPLALLAITLGGAGMALYTLGAVTIAVWGIVLAVLAVRETFTTTNGRAALIYFLPLIVILLLMVAVAVVVMAISMTFARRF